MSSGSEGNDHLADSADEEREMNQLDEDMEDRASNHDRADLFASEITNKCTRQTNTAQNNSRSYSTDDCPDEVDKFVIGSSVLTKYIKESDKKLDAWLKKYNEAKKKCQQATLAASSQPPTTIKVTVTVTRPSKETSFGLSIDAVDAAGTKILRIKSITPNSLCDNTALKAGMLLESINGAGYTTWQQGFDSLKTSEGKVTIVAVVPRTVVPSETPNMIQQATPTSNVPNDEPLFVSTKLEVLANKINTHSVQRGFVDQLVHDKYFQQWFLLSVDYPDRMQWFNDLIEVDGQAFDKVCRSVLLKIFRFMEEAMTSDKDKCLEKLLRDFFVEDGMQGGRVE